MTTPTQKEALTPDEVQEIADGVSAFMEQQAARIAELQASLDTAAATCTVLKQQLRDKDAQVSVLRDALSRAEQMNQAQRWCAGPCTTNREVL